MHRFAGGRAGRWIRVVRMLAVTRPRKVGRVVALGLAIPYVAWLTFAYTYHFIDGVNLLIHEAGHLIFTPLGETWHFLGGTLLQLGLPLAFCAYFLRWRDRFAAALLGIWVAESLMNVGLYMGDAIRQELPLVGGTTHDWGWLLTQAGLLRHAEALGFFTHVFASCLAGGMVWVAWLHLNHVPGVLGSIYDPAVEATEALRCEESLEQQEPARVRPLGQALGGAWPDVPDEPTTEPTSEPVDQTRRRPRQRRVLV